MERQEEHFLLVLLEADLVEEVVGVADPVERFQSQKIQFDSDARGEHLQSQQEWQAWKKLRHMSCSARDALTAPLVLVGRHKRESTPEYLWPALLAIWALHQIAAYFEDQREHRNLVNGRNFERSARAASLPAQGDHVACRLEVGVTVAWSLS